MVSKCDIVYVSDLSLQLILLIQVTWLVTISEREKEKKDKRKYSNTKQRPVTPSRLTYATGVVIPLLRDVHWSAVRDDR